MKSVPRTGELPMVKATRAALCGTVSVRPGATPTRTLADSRPGARPAVAILVLPLARARKVNRPTVRLSEMLLPTT